MAHLGTLVGMMNNKQFRYSINTDLIDVLPETGIHSLHTSFYPAVKPIRGDFPLAVLVQWEENDLPRKICLPSKQSEGSSNQHVAEQPSKPRNDSSNPRAEQRNPTEGEGLRDPTEELRKQGTHEPAKDPFHLPSRPITRARAKKFNEVIHIHMLIQQAKQARGCALAQRLSR